MIKILKKRPIKVRPDVSHGYRGYDSAADRDRAIAMLRKEGNNYFVRYIDVKSRYALCFSWASWVGEGHIHVV